MTNSWKIPQKKVGHDGYIQKKCTQRWCFPELRILLALWFGGPMDHQRCNSQATLWGFNSSLWSVLSFAMSQQLRHGCQLSKPCGLVEDWYTNALWSFSPWDSVVKMLWLQKRRCPKASSNKQLGHLWVGLVLAVCACPCGCLSDLPIEPRSQIRKRPRLPLLQVLLLPRPWRHSDWPWAFQNVRPNHRTRDLHFLSLHTKSPHHLAQRSGNLVSSIRYSVTMTIHHQPSSQPSE